MVEIFEETKNVAGSVGYQVHYWLVLSILIWDVLAKFAKGDVVVANAK